MTVCNCKTEVNFMGNSSFHNAVADDMWRIGSASGLLKKRLARFDRVDYIYKERSRFILCKRNVTGMRR